MIAATTGWEAFPALWPRLLGEVWDAVRADAATVPGRNVMLYRDRDAHVEVEVGVEVEAAFAPLGAVVPGSLPAGRVAMTTHRGSYEELGAAHRELLEWCGRGGRAVAGTRWEIYGHRRASSPVPEVEVYVLLV